jgi:small subunit ribosomal protein S17
MEERGRRKTQIGVVTSDKMAKTVVVRIETVARHPLYKKTVRRFKTLKAHNEDDAAKAGDRVLITETRPMSKDKRWRVVEVLEKAR